jgi:hypothetical protein
MPAIHKVSNGSRYQARIHFFLISVHVKLRERERMAKMAIKRGYVQ